MRTLRTLIAVAALAAGVLPERALACSCAGPGDPREELANADGAFYGELLERRATGPGLSSGEPVMLRYRVIRVFKGDIGAEVEVETAASGASCGIEAEIGDRDGLLLQRDAQGGWSGNLCLMRSEEHLAAGLEPMPEPDGQPPARFLAGGGFGGPRIAALDAGGRVLGYGDGPGDVRALDVCRGAGTAVELVTGLDGRVGVAVRDVATLAAREPVLLRLRGDQRDRLAEDATAVACGARDGSRSFAFVTDYSDRSRIVALDGAHQRELWRGAGYSALFGGETAFVGGAGAGAVAVDLATGRERVLSGAPAGADLVAVSPDARTLALAGVDAIPVLVDARSGRVVPAPRRAGFRRLAGVVARRFGTAAISGRSLYRVRERRLVRAGAGGRRSLITRRLFSPGIAALAVLPPRPRASSASPRSCLRPATWTTMAPLSELIGANVAAGMNRIAPDPALPPRVVRP